MNWSDVGGWIKDNAGNGAALVGSLLTGNVSGAIAAGVSMVSGVTGTTDPEKALIALQADPKLLIELERVKNDRSAEINRHIETMALADIEDKQKQHEQTQLTIRNGDNAEGGVKWIRPLHSTASLIFAMVYTYNAETIDPYVLGLFLSLPFAYGGLREFGKHSLNKISSVNK